MNVRMLLSFFLATFIGTYQSALLSFALDSQKDFVFIFISHAARQCPQPVTKLSHFTVRLLL
jgi:hypothetical protein